MKTLKGPMFVFLVMGIVVIPPLVCAQEAELSEQVGSEESSSEVLEEG